MRPSDRAWIALGAGVLAWDMVCPDDEMLSEASRRYAQAHPLIAYVVVAAVATHLIGRLPKRTDPIHFVGGVLRELRWTLGFSHRKSTVG